METGLQHSLWRIPVDPNLSIAQISARDRFLFTEPFRVFPVFEFDTYIAAIVQALGGYAKVTNVGTAKTASRVILRSREVIFGEWQDATPSPETETVES